MEKVYQKDIKIEYSYDDAEKTFSLPLIIYGEIVLICFTTSQKIIDIPQNWPLLYYGIFLVAIHLHPILFRFINNPRSFFQTESNIIFCFLSFYILATSIFCDTAYKNWIISMLTGPIFVVSLFAYKTQNMKMKDFVVQISIILTCFAILEALVAWAVFAGAVIPLEHQLFLHRPEWDWRLHGITGEPTHFGAVMGIGFLSMLFLYYNYRKKSLIFMLGFLFLGTSMLVSGSRNAVISFVLSVLSYLTLKGKLRTIVKGLVVSSIIAWLAMFSNLFRDFGITILRIKLEQSASIRLEKLCHAKNLLNRMEICQLLFGKGHDFLVTTPSFMNQYVEIFLGYGIIWISVAAIMVGFVLWRYYELRAVNKNLASYGIALMIFSLTYFLLFAPLFKVFHLVSFIFYFSIIVCINAKRIDIFENNSNFL